MENIDDYLEYYDGDMEEAFNEAISESGEFWIGTQSNPNQILLEDL